MTLILEEYELASDINTMILSKVLDGVTVTKMFQTMYGRMVVTHEVEVHRIQYDSRKIVRGDLFVAIHGADSDGHRFINDAISKGAKVVVVDDDTVMSDSFFMHAGVAKVVVPNTRIALAQLSNNYFDHPSQKLTMIGVTGTNGKTTTTHLLKSMMDLHGNRTGLIGTIEYRIGEETVPATHTTPESLELNELLARMVDRNCSAGVIEVSSHALHQHRVEGICFTAAVFTNLTQDHLDYHGTMEEYFNAKKILFNSLPNDSWAVVNMDDEWGKRLLNSTSARTISYGMNSHADVQARDLSLTMTGTRFTIVHGGVKTSIDSSLIGRFNVSNILAAFSTGIALGIPKSTLQDAIRNATIVRGRFEQIVSPKGWTAVIDYAHSPDALEKALKAVHDVFEGSRQGRIITVFGCGGNRDRTKRPKMARVATTLSHITIITSDNPRQENADAIIDEVMTGIEPGSMVQREGDRKKAVEMALDLAKSGDVVFIAGKGHEDYQVIGDRKIHFSDREVVEEYLAAHA